MDTAGIALLAATLTELAEREVRVSVDNYFELRTSVFELVGDEGRLLEPLFPLKPQLAAGGTVSRGAAILGVVAVYLHALVSGGPPAGGRLAAATDLMEQSQRLFEDDDVTVVAPIVVAGAALEQILRGLVDTAELEVPTKPSLTAYAQALRRASMLTPDDVKEVTSLASIRNDAAHGRTELLSRDRAGLFLDRVNLFLRHLQDRESPPLPPASRG